MIIFENPGEIDIDAVTTFGVSVKTSLSAIGYFGTGLKYAIAVLLRNGQRITLYSGLRRYDFSTVTQSIRGKDFELVLCNGEKMGLTTEVGKNWQLWMAMRELYCNAKDEGGASYYALEAKPEEGKTLVAIEGEAFQELWKKRHAYFLEEPPTWRVGPFHIHDKPATHLFYKGVAVYKLEKPSLLTYDAQGSLTLTEDRTLAETYSYKHYLTVALSRKAPPDLLKRVLSAEEKTFEGGLIFERLTLGIFGDEGVKQAQPFLATVETLMKEKIATLNNSARKLWEEVNPKKFAPDLLKPTKLQKAALERAIDFCVQLGFPVNKYEIVLAQSLGAGILGLAHEGKIYLTAQCFDVGGAKALASTLIEEYLHVENGWKDGQRELQNFLFDRLVTLGQEALAFPL